jgi:hypothetical protein
MEWVYLLAMAKKGASVGCDFRRGWNLSVDVLRAGKWCEKLCGDLLACTKGSVRRAK